MNNIIKVIAVTGIMIGTGNMQDINCEAAIPEVTAYACENSEISLQASKVTWVYNLPFGSVSAGRNHAYRVRNYDSANYTFTSFKDEW